MSEAKEPANLNEVMGKDTEITLDNLKEILGETMPEIPFDRVGRMRLIGCLQQRFGQGFRNIPGVKNVLEHFDKEVEAANIIKMNRRKK